MVEQVAGTSPLLDRSPYNTHCRRPVAAAALAWAAGLLAAGPMRAATTADAPEAKVACTVAKSSGINLAESIALEPDPTVSPRLLTAAIELWSACSNYGSSFPRLVAGARGSRVIRVEAAPRLAGRRCGSFAANTIRLHMVARNGPRLVPCTPSVRILAHEIGHALGLADAPPSPSCRDHIMAQADQSQVGGRRVQAGECQVVGQHWLTPEEHDVQERLVTQWNREVSNEEVQ
jgi:hypothetical protein